MRVPSGHQLLSSRQERPLRAATRTVPGGGLSRTGSHLWATEEQARASELDQASAERPAYRNLVRGLIPAVIHQPYWTRCHVVDAAEVYIEDCPEGVDPPVSAAAVREIRSHPDIHQTLTRWVGFSCLVTAALDHSNEA